MAYFKKKGKGSLDVESSARIEYTCVNCNGTRFNTAINIQKQKNECLYCKKCRKEKESSKTS